MGIALWWFQLHASALLRYELRSEIAAEDSEESLVNILLDDILQSSPLLELSMGEVLQND